MLKAIVEVEIVESTGDAVLVSDDQLPYPRDCTGIAGGIQTSNRRPWAPVNTPLPMQRS